MNESDLSHSPSTNNVVLLRPQSQSPSLPLSEGIKENSPSLSDSEVGQQRQQESPRAPPKLALVPSVPTIHLDQELHVVLEQAMRALAADPLLFAKGDQLVRVIAEGESPRLTALGSAQLREVLSVRAKWMKEDPVHPPASVATALVRRGAWSHIRELRAMTTFPVLSAQGELRTREGYDPSTKTFYTGGAVVSVPEEPTIDDAKGTERMRDHYSSVSAGEQRDGIGKVLQLAGAGMASEPASPRGMHCGMHPTQAVLNAAGTKAGCV
jgi:hypothetical protein